MLNNEGFLSRIDEVLVNGQIFYSVRVGLFDSLNLAKKDKDTIVNILKNSGYYFAEVKLNIISNSNNTVSLIYDIELGKKAKIRKIKSLRF